MALMYEEDTKYRTEVGSVLTIILLIAVLTFVATKVRVLISQDSDQNYYQFSTDRDLYDPDELINLHDNQFQFAFGNLDEEIPINYGRWTVTYKQKIWHEG